MPEKIVLKKLPPLSDTIVKIFELDKKTPSEAVIELPRIIEKDPGISSEILKIANSPYYGFISEISSITHAVNLLGIETVKNLALRLSISNMIANLKKSDEINKDIYNYYIKRSLISAVFSKTFSKVNGIGSPEKFLTIGLMLKIGELILIVNFGMDYDINPDGDEEEILLEEKNKFGMDSVEVGKWVVTEWNLPIEFYEAINNNVELKQQTEIAKISYIANYFSKILLKKKKENQDFIEIRNKIKEIFNFDVSELELFKDEFKEEIKILMMETPFFKDELLQIKSQIEKISYALFEEEVKQIIEEDEIKILKRKLFCERKKLMANTRLVSTLNWGSDPDFIINKLLLHLKTILKNACEEFKFIYWDDKGNKFIAYKLDGVKNISYEYEMRKSPIYQKAFSLRELQIKSFEDRIITAIPVFFGTHSFGIISIIFIKGEFNYEILKNLTISAGIVAQSFQNYKVQKLLKKEIEKRLILISEIKDLSQQKKKITELLKEVEENHLHKYILKSIIHKINNKMTPILGYSEMLLNSLQGKELEKMEKINKNTEEAINLLNNILEHFSLLKEREEVIDINETIEETIGLLEYRTKGYNITIKKYFNNELPKIYFNKIHLRDVVSNLLANAIDATKESNKETKIIEIFTDYKDYQFFIRVKDNGIGIEEDKIEKVTEPFYTTKKNYPGLGLNFVHGFVHTYGGNLEIKSKKEEGTEVKLSFSAKIVKETEKKKEKRIEEAKILIIDDEESLVELMDEILSMEGFSNLKNAFSGEEAIDLIEKEDFDLIVSDVNLSKFSGLDVFRKLKNKGVENRLVFVTANPQDRELINISNIHKIPVLKKPFSLSDFTNIIKSRIKNIYSEV